MNVSLRLLFCRDFNSKMDFWQGRLWNNDKPRRKREKQKVQK